MRNARRVLGAQAAQAFSPVGSRAQTPLSPSKHWKLHHHHHPPSLSYSTTTDNLAPIHIHRLHSYRLQLLAVPSIIHPFRPTASRSKRHPPGVIRFAAKTNSLHHHQKVRSYLRPAIDRNARRPSTDPRPRGNDTALVRTRRFSKIANQQALASRSQSRGHSSASE